ncbi:uncharacterized protein LOC127251695 isoform X2 [Andrographis paniculata]|uniref:uncharacterized protein LOC127251695 isoform X2 n=1 Tax=Andrographis paniculata TaxID=175694 RepID=UPI0021E7AE44|nr:uncharacterized protein LOC127251695 isoform X2 [Andrographis paniculata]
MEEEHNEKSRRERRKEARLAKNKKKFDSWVQHQQSAKSKESIKDTTQSTKKSESGDDFGESSRRKLEKGKKSEDFKELKTSRSSKYEKDLKQKKSSKKSSNSKFFDYLRMETEGRVPSAEEDLMIERRLAKKLKVKNGRLSAGNDDFDTLLDGIPSVLDYLDKDGEATPLADNGDLTGERGECSSADDEDGVSNDEEDGLSDDEEDGVSNDEEDGVSDDEEDGLSDDEEDEESDSLVDSEDYDNIGDRISPGDSKKRKRQKTRFEEYLENNVDSGRSSAEADLALERKLAKKLKIKTGKLGGDDDEMNMLLEGIPSVLDSKSKHEERPKTDISSKKGASKPIELSSEMPLENAPNSREGKYVAPHLRSINGNESTEHAQVRKRVRGLLNRLSETNVESITNEISTLFHSVGRSVGSQIITEEVVSSCSGGPRGSEQYAAVFAAFVAGMTCMVGIDFGAKLLAHLAKCFEEEYLKEDNLSLRNITLLLSYLYVFGLCSSELIYDFLIMLGKQLTEVDVSTVLTVLQCCGMKLRGDDPTGMKNFIMSVQSRVNELKAASEAGQSNISNKRMEFMLETILDIKNNKKRRREDTVQHSRIKKWLQKLRVDDILIRGLKWSKLLDRDKKGQWWLSGDLATTTENVEEVAGTIDKEITETKRMLELAAAQRMNTDARRAIFCVIMSGEDYIDAFEKLLRLDLPGKQDREIMRVLVECCLQEKVFNKYYCVLASKLCSHDKNHKFTLQYCLWDHFKELESMPLIRSMHLAKFTAEMVACFSLSLAVLKVVDLNDIISLTPKRIMHFRMLFEAILEFPDKLTWNIFTRIAGAPEHELLRSGILLFIGKYIVTSQKSLEKKFKLAKKALNNVEGVLM